MPTCSHKDFHGNPCQRTAVRKCVNKRTDESHFCCSVHLTMHARTYYALFKIDASGRSLPPPVPSAA